jgi:hypothetical protein
MPREEAYGLTVSTTRVREFAEVLGAAGARQISKVMPWGGVATDFQPSYALTHPV